MSTNYSEKEMHPSAAYGCNSTLFGDKRLDERYRKILGELTAKPNTSIMQALGDIHQAKACYRFWDNEKVSPGRILLQHKEETMSRISKHDDILAPLDRKLTQAIQAVKLTAIRVREEEPPADKTGIEWYLLTTLTVNDIEDVKTCTKYYSYRWLIERYHFTLKSGCQVEELQLETVPRLMNAIATYCIVGWRVFYLAYLARFLPETEAENIVTKDELEVLYFQFNPQKMELPEKAPTAREIVIWVARLGGFAARKSDGMPGVKTLWRGFLSLEYMVKGWVAARSHFSNLSENIKSFSHYP